MPEIKNTFLAGRLNKDLDERLISPGEYRDALNVNIGTSESSDASTVENLLGNELKGPGLGSLTTTRTVTTPGTPGTPEVPAVPAVPDSTIIENHEFNVVSYTGQGPAQPASATQTIRVNGTFSSSDNTTTTTGGYAGSGGASVKKGVVIGTYTGDGLNGLLPTNTTTFYIRGNFPPYTENNPGNAPQVGDKIIIGLHSATLYDPFSNYTPPASGNQTVTITSAGAYDASQDGYLITIDTLITIPHADQDPDGNNVGTYTIYGPVGPIAGTTTGGFNYTLTAGSMLDANRTTFLHNEQLKLTDSNNNSFIITFDCGGVGQTSTQGEASSFTTSSTFNFSDGDILTFQRFYEFNGFVSTFDSVVSTSPRVHRMVTHTLSVGDFYGYRQPSILEDEQIPYVTAVNGNDITLSAAPLYNSDTTNVGFTTSVYNLAYVGGAGALDGTPPEVVVTKVNSENPNPAVGETIAATNATIIDAVSESSGEFTLTLREELTPTPLNRYEGSNGAAVRRGIVIGNPANNFAIPNNVNTFDLFDNTYPDSLHPVPNVGDILVLGSITGGGGVMDDFALYSLFVPIAGNEIMTITDVTVNGSSYTVTVDNPIQQPDPLLRVQLMVYGPQDAFYYTTLNMPRQITVPGTPEIPAIPAIPGTPDIVETITESIGTSAVCIGAISDESSGNIYWFIHANDYDGIYEYVPALETVNTLIRGDLNFSTDFLITGINIIDDMLFWTDDKNEPRKLNISKWKKANHSSVPTRIYSRNFLDSDLTVIKPHPKERLTIKTVVDADKEILPFEEIFPQFAYRWKFSDGEYSPFSFFTEPVFEVDEYDTKEHFKEGYNKAARNIVTEITVGNIPRGEQDVIEVEVLYTESISSTVYTLKTIRKKDFGTDPNYIKDQVFTKRSFYSALPDNQLSRHFDSIPTLAKAQEITANRLIYGNYDFGFEQEASADITVTQKEKSTSSGLSVKGARDYEVGVVYEDTPGRQGALLVGEGTKYTTKFSTSGTQSLAAKITSAAPIWATHFKYYVKDSSNDHHNFPVYNTFNDGEGDKNNSEFIWLQIDSNDRNKVSEDTFIIPRRHTHGDLIAGNGTNSLAFTKQSKDLIDGSLSNIDFNVDKSYNEQKRDTTIWAPGIDARDQSTVHNGGNSVMNNPDWIFTCTVAGKYTFEFEGDLKHIRHTRAFNVGKNAAYIQPVASFQKVKAGQFFGSLNHSFEESAKFTINSIKEGGNADRDFRFYVTVVYDLEAGDRVRPFIFKNASRRNGFVYMDIVDPVFRTLTTPVDPNATAPPVEQFNHIVKNLSKHRIIEIENEAPDIVKNQLPVETKKIGNTVKYERLGNNDKAVFLTSEEFEGPDNNEVPVDNNLENSTELFYEARNNSVGYKNISLIPALNNILAFENLGALEVSGDSSEIQPSERVQTIDVSELEGGLWYGVGNAGLDNTAKSTANKVKILEISLGFSQWALDRTHDQRDILKIVLEEPVGVNPRGQDFAIFKGEITENALKNIQGSFFAKIKRNTNSKKFTIRKTLLGKEIKIPIGLHSLPTGQSTFNEENEVNTLQTIWFETVPEVEDSNLNLFWEASKSIPIAEHGNTQTLDFYNCIAFVKDGVFLETQRVFDKFNSVQMAKGVRVNVPQENYAKERRKAGLIFSGIYNSRTGTNRLNEFVYSDGITKDLEPNYGSLQKLHTRDTNLVALCESKVFTIMADKDILYSGSGSPQVIASNRVLGQTTPFLGDFGIGLDPSSFASYANRMYFTDRQRGSVIRISTDGITEISEAGMRDFFRDKLNINSNKLIGSYDSYNGQYVLSLDDYSITFSENQKGWVSRVSYVPEAGVSVNNIFYTFNQGDVWQHNSINVNRNNFYNVQYKSYLTTVFNQEPSAIKSFKTINYEGTAGWQVPFILTDQQAGYVIDFENKEGKWYNNINGISNVNVITELNNLIDPNGPIDFYKKDNLKSISNGLANNEDAYEFSIQSNSSQNEYLGIGQLTSIINTGGLPPSAISGDTTITFNVQ